MQNEKRKTQADKPAFDISERCFAFAVQVVRLCRSLDANPGVFRELARQLLRSGTSIGANLEEAQAGQSRADFICKCNIALKEARETSYWLRLIDQFDNRSDIDSLAKEAMEIARILGSVIVSARRNTESR